MHRSCPLSCLLLLASALSAQTATGTATGPAVPPGVDLKDPQALLSVATGMNSLDDTRGTPWHLKASYESFDEKGSQVDQGTFEEWRLAPDQWKRTYSSGHFNQTEYSTATGITYETSAGAPLWPVSLIAKELVHPMPDSKDLEDTKPEIRPLNEKSARFNCVMLSLPLKSVKWSLGALPTYCFDLNTPTLRMEIFDASIQVLRNEMAVFQSNYIAKEVQLNDGRKPLLHMHVLSLTSLSPAEAASVVLPTSSDSSPSPAEVSVASGVVDGHKTGGPVPEYPVLARRNRIQGVVVLKISIGTDGHIHRLRVVSSPDPSLSSAAIDAVQRWAYHPFLLKGKPVIVNTTLDVTFRLG